MNPSTYWSTRRLFGSSFIGALSGAKLKSFKKLLPVKCRLQAALTMIILGLISQESSGGLSNQELSERLKIVYECDFQSRHDTNVDRQPDGWRRRRDRIHPAYIQAQIVPRDVTLSRQAREFQLLVTRLYQSWKHRRPMFDYVPESIPPALVEIMDGTVVRNCYEVRMDGGAFELVSPRFPIDSRLSYRLQAEMASDNLLGHEANIELHILDETGKLIELFATPKISNDQQWQQVHSSPIVMNHQPHLLGEIHLKVQPKGNGHSRGRVQFDNIQVNQYPRVSLDCDSPAHFIVAGDSTTVTLNAIGLPTSTDSVHFQLLDVEDQVIAQQSVPLQTIDTIEALEHSFTNRSLLKTRERNRKKSRLHDGSKRWTVTQAQWKPVMDQSGYFRICASLAPKIQKEVALLVTQATMDPPGPFGWSILNSAETLLQDSHIDILQRAGVGWLKVPVWIDYRDAQAMEWIGKRLTSLQSMGIRCVGVLDHPPRTADKLFGEEADKLHPVAVISEPRVWKEAMEPIVTQLGLKMQWLQIGEDNDRSLSENASLREQLRDVYHKIQSTGQELKLVVGWDWHHSTDPEPSDLIDGQAVWKALAYSSDDPLTTEELLKKAEESLSTRWRTWAAIQPLPASNRSLSERVLDLVEQMVVVKRSGMQAAFIHQLADDERGLFHSNHSVGELMFPWIQMASTIGPKEYEGSLDLPMSSTNHVFTDDHSAVVLLWNTQAVTETLYLGHEIEVTDIWGRSVPFESVRLESGSWVQKIPVGTWPLIIRQADGDVIRWQQRFELLTDHLPSEISVEGVLPVQLQNTLTRSVEGRLSVISASLIDGGSFSQGISIPFGEGLSQDMPFDFRPDASTGQHTLEFAFDLKADRRHQFSIFREVRLGHPHIDFQWQMNRLSQNRVEVKVDLINETDSPVSFDCKLFPRNAVYQRLQILDGASGKTSHSFHLSVPSDSVIDESPVWVRCEQIGTNLVLNYRIFEQQP